MWHISSEEVTRFTPQSNELVQRHRKAAIDPETPTKINSYVSY